MDRATVERNGQLATLVASDVVQRADKMTFLVDSASPQA